MLKEIEFKNFLPYKNQVLTLPLNSTIAVVGKNGHGKSSFLEGIMFALYGDGRGDLKSLRRIAAGSSAEMYVRLVYQLHTDQIMVVKRGLRASGSGYTQVWLDDLLVAKGGASPANNKAQDFINGALGMDLATFKLTAFFGLGVNDTLMQVRPAERLETLQKVAGIDVCMKFQSAANEKYKTLTAWIDKETHALDMLSDSLEDVHELQKSVNADLAKLTELREKQDDLAVEHRNLRTEEDKYQGLLREKEGLIAQQTILIKQKESAENAVLEARDEFTQAKTDVDTYIRQRDGLETELQEMLSDTEESKVVREQLQQKITQAQVNYELRTTALSTDTATSVCPLCGNAIEDHTLDVWKRELTELQQAIKQYKKELKQHTTQVELYTALQDQLSTNQDALNIAMHTAEAAKKTGKAANKQRKLYVAELNSIQMRLNTIETSLRGYESVLKRLNVNDQRTAEILQESGQINERIQNKRIRIKSVKNAQKTIKQKTAIVQQKQQTAAGYKIVADAFSRHAIPVQLLENLRTVLERRATLIYRQFSSGSILIIDIPGARPGLDFALQDELGQRTYKALSSGERVMFFLAIRIALSQIINAGKNNNVDFLVLDEIAGNLDPDNRNNLTRLINALLKKFFPQILLVSHVEMRDIFSKTLTVTKANGIAHIQ